MGSFLAVKRSCILAFEHRGGGFGEGTADRIRLIVALFFTFTTSDRLPKHEIWELSSIKKNHEEKALKVYQNAADLTIEWLDCRKKSTATLLISDKLTNI